MVDARDFSASQDIKRAGGEARTLWCIRLSAVLPLVLLSIVKRRLDGYVS